MDLPGANHYAKDPSGWWSGQSLNGKKGIFPHNFVQIIDPKEREIPQTPRSKAGTLKLQEDSDYIKKIRVSLSLVTAEETVSFRSEN